MALWSSAAMVNVHSLSATDRCSWQEVINAKRLLDARRQSAAVVW